ncbi:bile acid:sodium symporter family protein [candidate division KSB1 bacterium]|nr:bile acid:sodium symporter family protein [candidate division KSB1 bacterium]
MDRILTGYNRLFVLWVVIGGAAAFFYPGMFLPLKNFIEYFFALTMFGVGMVLKPEAFINIFKNIKVVLIGVLAQFSVMPLSAFIISKLFRFSDEFSLGLILTGSAPGAMASNILSYLAGADVAYSVSLTTSSTLLAPLLTPLLTLLLAHTILDVPFWGMFISVVRMVLVPLALGLAAKKLFDRKVQPIAKVFPAISTTFIVFICALVIALNKEYILKIDLWIFIAAIVLNLTGLSAGYWIGKAFRFDELKKRALSIEIGMQNAGLGSVLALKHFNEKVALPAVIFVFICIFSASLLVPIWSKSKPGESEADPIANSN